MCVNGSLSQKEERVRLREKSIVSDIPVRETELRNWRLGPNKRIAQGIKKIQFNSLLSRWINYEEQNKQRRKLERKERPYREKQKKGKTPDGGLTLTWRQSRRGKKKANWRVENLWGPKKKKSLQWHKDLFSPEEQYRTKPNMRH